MNCKEATQKQAAEKRPDRANGLCQEILEDPEIMSKLDKLSRKRRIGLTEELNHIVKALNARHDLDGKDEQLAVIRGLGPIKIINALALASVYPGVRKCAIGRSSQDVGKVVADYEFRGDSIPIEYATDILADNYAHPDVIDKIRKGVEDSLESLYTEFNYDNDGERISDGYVRRRIKEILEALQGILRQVDLPRTTVDAILENKYLKDGRAVRRKRSLCRAEKVYKPQALHLCGILEVKE